MKKVHKENMLKLIKYVKGNVKDVNFSMLEYSNGFFDGMYKPKDICGTVACMAGNAVMIATIEDFQSSIKEGDEKLYSTHPYLFFRSLISHMFGIEPESIEYEWLFSDCWGIISEPCGHIIDNSPLGACARMEHFIANGVPDWFTQYISTHEFIYATEFKFNKYAVSLYQNLINLYL